MNTDTRPILEVDRITKEFRKTRALEDVSFSLEKGKILGILGPNGAGKTTLLKIISTLILPDKGTVTVNGYRLSVDDEKIKSFIGLAASPERTFYWRLTGRQNLEFFAAMYGLDKKSAKSKIEKLFSLFEIDYQNRRFDSYSTGMKQKFAIIRCLLNDPELLLLDEPTKSLDYATALNLRNLIKENLVKREGKTVIFTTHQMDEALNFCELFMILHKGKVHGLGALGDLRTKINNPSAGLGEIFLKLTEGS